MSLEKYDVVVIGSGMGGLSSGALLAHTGYKTLIVEKDDRVGGRFSTEEVEGFKLPSCSILIETGGSIERVFREVDADFKVNPAPMYYWIEGKYYELPTKGRVRALLGILGNIEAERAKITGRIAKEIAVEKVMGAFRRGVMERLTSRISFRDWLRQYTDNEKVLDVFQALIVTIHAVNSWELPASEFFAFAAGGGGGIGAHGVAPRGNIILAESLVGRVRAKGGEVWTNALAKQIKVTGGKAKSVVVERGATEVEVEAQVVISNTGPRKTVELVGAEKFGEKYIKEMNERLRPIPIIGIFIASDRPLTDLMGVAMVVGLRRTCFLMPMSNICPELAPPGKHLTATWGAPLSCLDYMNVDEEIGALIEDARDLFPDFGKYGRIIKTVAHQKDDEHPAYHTWPGWDLPQKTPIVNLFNVGDGVKPSGMTGLPSCAETGRIVAEEVKKRFKPQRK